VAQERVALPDPGDIAGRYEVVQKLGAGAFGTVYKAKDRLLGRMVAIKTIRLDGLAASGSGLDELLARFKREAQVSAQLKHPNIVTIYDISETEGLSYLAMEFIDGPGLEKVIASAGRLSVERAAAIGAQIADALDYAHAHHVVHRDIKPANVMIEAGDRVKVTDFGIAKAIGSGEHLTVTGSLLGTPSYMSPEQARGTAVDGRSDLFSVGCILYEMVTGKKAFRGDSITALIFKIITEEPQPVGELEPAVPAPFTQIIARALSKDPETRFQSGRELAAALLAITSPTAIPTLRQVEVATVVAAAPLAPPTIVKSSTAVPSQTARVAGVSTLASSSPSQAQPARQPRPPAPVPARRRRSPLAVIAVLALLAIGAMFTIGVVAWMLIPERTTPSETSGTTDAATPTAEETPSATGASPASTPAPDTQVADSGASSRTGTLPSNATRTPLPQGSDSGVWATPAPPVSATPDPRVGRTDDFTFLEQDADEPSGDSDAGRRLSDTYRSGRGHGDDAGSSSRFRRRRLNPRPEHPGERPGIRVTRGLMIAEAQLKRRTGRYGSLSDLSAVVPQLHVLRGEKGFQHAGYRFDVLATSDSFTILATPLRSGMRAFSGDSESDYITVSGDD
jgi:serine/threonine protein kinase